MVPNPNWTASLHLSPSVGLALAPGGSTVLSPKWYRLKCSGPLHW